MSKIRVVPVVVVLAVALAAQVPEPPVASQVTALMLWDPDGAGPKPQQLVVGGWAMRDRSLDDNIALYDPRLGYWSELGRGVDGAVRALAVLPNGDLVVGGDFEEAGDASAPRVARWDGERWHTLGASVDDSLFTGVHALAVGAQGSLFAGGSFAIAGAVRVANLAKWHAGGGRGGEWSDVGDGVEDAAYVSSLAVLGGGDLLVAGHFALAGRDHASNIARWDGTRWHVLEWGVGGLVNAVLPVGKREFLVGGHFDRAGVVLASNVARWDGERWRALGGGIDGAVTCMARMANGHILVGGQEGGVWRWDGKVWHDVGDLERQVSALVAMPDGEVLAGGDGLHSWRGGEWVTILDRDL